MSGTNSRQVSWSRSWDFMFATAGWSIGLGNIWRFPYLCYQYGGGAFLIPYIFFGFVFALPCLMLEASLGQMVRKNLIDTWRSKVPVFTGIAYANMVMSFLFVIHYATLLVWIVKYFGASFSTILPWISCKNTWNDERCVDFTIQNKSELFSLNQLNGTRGESAAEQYWKLNVLKISSGINEVGSLQLDLMAYSALVWLLIYLSTFKGIKFSAKVSYITATLPAILIVVMVILGLTLDGSMAGISHYLRPDISKLADFEGGPYVFELFNQSSSVAWNFFIICGCELVAVAWFYGAKKHCQLIRRMIGPTRTENVIIFFWKYFTLAWCLALAAYSIVFHKALTYGNYVYPSWAQAFAHTLSFSSFVWIPGYAIYLLLTSKKTKAELLGRGSQCSNNDDEKENDEVDEAQIELQCTKLVESSVA
ncbi:unnamed protein product [Clavelina lepadiformis]|uniref:Transporter n=1 Tax=Clavelina lepadiformis TaxID=159417 RepID=A0ABP0FGF1_CLALP